MIKREPPMTLTHFLLFIALALFVITRAVVIKGIRTKNWKKVVISVVVFSAIILFMYFGLIRFITSM